MLFVSFSLFFTSFCLNAQDSIVPQQSVAEKTNLEFQEHFFKAITEKAIRNYQSAISSLEECNELIPNNSAVLFELSKNYLKLKKYPEGIEYCKQALAKDPKNIWILEHLVKLHRKSYNFKEAIKIQEKIAVDFPKKKRLLVFLHLQNNDRKSAKKVLDELTEAKMLNSRLRNLKKSLEKQQRKTIKKNEKVNITEEDLKTKFQKNKSYALLQELLIDLDTKNDNDLLKYSETGLTLFPAQPLVYLMYGKALNKQNQFKEAVDNLKNGIDFIIDDKKMEKSFYIELVKSFKGLGDMKNAKKYQKKI